MDQRPIVFFDGHCGLCNRSVDWILRHDARHQFLFAPLQGTTASDLFKTYSEEELLRSFWLKDSNGLHRKSTAILKVCRRLGGVSALLSLAIIVPRPIRDFFYDLVAKNRYRIWGRSETCRIPTSEERAHFLP